jgi:ferredoxin
MSVAITIDGREVQVAPGTSVLQAARALGLDIPTLCYLEKCGPLNSCLVCLVKINGKLVPSCGTSVQPGMVVESDTVEVHEARRTALELLFSDHVGDCLSPCNRLCPLRLNIPLMLRQIQAGQFGDASVTMRDALPLPGVLGRLCHHPCEQGCRRGTWDDPAAIRDLERFVSDWDHGREAIMPEKGTPAPISVDQAQYLPPCKPATGKTVAIIGAGPTGLAAAYHLLREGHACIVADRRKVAGGTLRDAPHSQALPGEVLDPEVRQLERLGAQFKLGVSLGIELSIDGLLRGCDAVLLAIGEVSQAEGQALGIEMASTGIRCNPNTFQTSRTGVFAAGRAVKPLNQVVRVMGEGQAAAQCIDQFLSGKKAQRLDRPFSSVMGRLEKSELKVLLHGANTVASVSPCDRCAGFNRKEASTEASRCLHCDCRASGNCALQSYAQAYGADASRYRQGRREFEQQAQPCGVIFEPGKCILCGICVKLTELAREPLGLTFVGRGFDVRVAAPLNGTIQDGLQKVAEECVAHCPTGALAFQEAIPATPVSSQPLIER